MLPQDFINSDAVQVNKLIDKAFQFPQNLVQVLPQDIVKDVTEFVIENYARPYIQERREFESKWDEWLDMYKLQVKQQRIRDNKKREDDKVADIISKIAPEDRDKNANVSDSLIFDSIDRLRKLTHFVSFKDRLPVQFTWPQHNRNSEDRYYHPIRDKIASANGLLEWNANNANIYPKHDLAAQHFFLYGCVFMLSDIEFKLKTVQHRTSQNTIQARVDIEKAGVTWQPVSCRRVWVDYTIPLTEFQRQSCPFYFTDAPLWEIRQNQYDPINNPFGYVTDPTRKFSGNVTSSPEMEAWRKGLRDEENAIGINTRPSDSPAQQRALWHFFPMLPLAQDPTTGEWVFDKDGTMGVPYSRFIMNVHGDTLSNAASIETVRIQKSYYPTDLLPMYGVSHIPDLDSGAYAPSVAETLETHYYELCKMMNQFIDNKDLMNDPPSWCVVGSPATTKDRNRKGAKLEVLSPEDFGWRSIPDATQTTQNMMQNVRSGAQTTAQTVDAIMGKAMGGRTTAREATNAFQASMSGITTVINLFNKAVMGGYAERVWAYCGLWFDTDLLKAITGMYGEPLTPEDLWIKLGIKTDVGSTFIESVVKSEHLRYAIEAGSRSDALDQSKLWAAFFNEIRLPEALSAIRDGGEEIEIKRSTEQAIETYLGRPIAIDPSQDHNVAIRVKTGFLQDVDSTWNKQYAVELSGQIDPTTGQPMTRAQYIAYQIQIHGYFQQMQQMQEQAAMQAQMAQQMQMQLPMGGMEQ